MIRCLLSSLLMIGLLVAAPVEVEQSQASRHAETTAGLKRLQVAREHSDVMEATSRVVVDEQLDMLLINSERIRILMERSDAAIGRRAKILSNREEANTLANRLQVINGGLQVLSITLLLMLFGMKRRY